MSALSASVYGASARCRSVLRRATAGAAVLAVAALASTANADVTWSVPTSCAGVTSDGAWTRLGTPTFSSGPAAVTGFAVASSGTTVYATNGISVASTTDLGCHWRAVFNVASTATGAERVTRVFTPPAGAAGTVYVATEQAAAGVSSAPAVTLHASSGAGANWTTGAALPGTVIDIDAGGGADAKTVYALLRQAPVAEPITGVTLAAATVLARTDDAGANWLVTANESSPNGPSVVVGAPPGAEAGTTVQFSGLSVDPGNAQHLWLTSPTGLHESADGGSTITLASPTTIEGAALASVSRTAAGRVQVAFSYKKSRFPAVGYTRAGAKAPNTFAVAQLPGATTSLAMGIRPGEFIAAGTRSVWLHRPYAEGFTLPVSDVSPARARLSDLVAIRRGSAADVTVFGRDGQQIEFRTMPAPKPPAPPRKPAGPRPRDGWDFVPDTTRIAKAGAPSINPDHVQITLPVGSQREIPYALSLPGTRKVDIFFLVDTTDSMADKIAAMKRGLGAIINGFAKAGVDARFGVGQYRAYETAPAYERMVDLVRPGPALAAAVSGLTAGGGTHKQTSLDALYQIATGKGLSSGVAVIAPGQQTHWRDDALHVVLHITDEGFATEAPHPTYEQAAAALNAVDAIQLGVGYESDDPVELLAAKARGEVPDPTGGLIEMARLTGALAPAEGADCDGDGQPDLLPGDPLVCKIDPKLAGDVAVLAPAIVNVVLAAPDFARVSVTWAAPQPVIAGVTPRTAPGVNLRHPATLTFRVTYACPASLPAGTGYPAALTARVRSQVVAVARARVDCVAPVSPVDLPPLAPGLALTVPPPPGQPLSNAQPNPQANPQSQPQTQPQAQAQAGAAFQEQESPQFAFAYTNTGTAPEPEQVWQFSVYHPTAPSPTPAPLFTLGAGGFAALAAARVLAVRRRQQHARATVRRPSTAGGR